MASKRKKPAREGRPTKDKSITFSVDSYEAFIGKFREPLFLLSTLTFVLTAARLVVSESLSKTMPNALLVVLIASIYFSVKESKKRSYWAYLIPLMVSISTLFAFYSTTWGYPADRDYMFFSLIAGIGALFTALTLYQVLKWELAAVLAITISSIILHMVPAYAQLIGNLDSYWQYKWMQSSYAGDIPELDNLVYPMAGGLQMGSNKTFVSLPQFGPGGHGLNQHSTPMLNSLVYSVLALVLKPFGFQLYDVAMLLPGLFGGLAVLPMYLLVSEMFSDMRPHNKFAGLLAAFILMLSPGFGINGTAANCEDDVFGMFLMLSGFYLFFASVHRRSFKYAVLTGLAFLMLKVTWTYTYAYLTIGAFGIIYAIILFIHRENCAKMVPYLFIAIALSQLSVLFTHQQMQFDVVFMLSQLKMPPIALFPIAGALGVPILLEAVRKLAYGGLEIRGKSLEDRVDEFIEKGILPLAVIVLVGGAIILYMEGGPFVVFDGLKTAVMAAKEKSIVHQTVSEQNPMVDLPSGSGVFDEFYSFLIVGYGKYGVAVIYAVLMVPIMVYLALKKRSIGALFVLTWSLPMMWGSYNKSAWIFAASPSITALGAVIGLYAAVNRDELNDWRIIGTMMAVFIPLLYIPFFGIWNYQNFVGYAVMHMGLTPDIYYWQPMLVWAYNNTAPNEAIITWWDYGHWITAVSRRPVLIDNLQADYYEIQDVARFFVNKTSEEEAFKIVGAYNDAYKRDGRILKYVAIDWTMIGKGSALHFIANGDIATNVPADPMWGFRNYGMCMFSPENSMLKPQLTSDGKGGFYQVQKLVFSCSQYIRGIVFTLGDNKVSSIDVIGPYGDIISWSNWAASSKASVLGVQSLNTILSCASNWGSAGMDEQTRYVCSYYPMFNTLIYVPDEFNDFMITRLYLSQHVLEYKAYGLYSRDVAPLTHFRMFKDFALGFVRVYEISYEGFNASETSLGALDNIALAPVEDALSASTAAN